MIRVLVPDMPTADELLPYLRRIDAEKIYTNGGPLVAELQTCITDLVRAPSVVVSNGTAALELVLRALRLPINSCVLVPAMTFRASAQAITNARLKPVLCDVDPKTWQLTPELAIDAAQGYDIRAVMPVAAFGMPVPIEPWEAFQRATRMPVLIDAAGAIAEQQVSLNANLITVFSLHATKFLGAGEGGVVSTGDRFLIERIAALAAFGHWGTNAKMSEYHAAVGLASIAVVRIADKLQRAGAVAKAYGEGLAKISGVTLQRPPRADATLLPVLLPENRDAEETRFELDGMGIQTNQWYRPFLDELQQFANCPRSFKLPTTQMLRDRMLGLPFHTGLDEAGVARVCTALTKALQ